MDWARLIEGLINNSSVQLTVSDQDSFCKNVFRREVGAVLYIKQFVCILTLWRVSIENEISFFGNQPES